MKFALGLLGLLILASVGFAVWGSITNPIMPEAAAALTSDAQVQVTTGNWLVFQPAGKTPDTAYIFYPGGKVDYRAYAPYAHEIAAKGYLVVIPRMPLNLAVFNASAARSVINAYPEIHHWVLGGHSLGGSMAANYTAHHPEQVDGLVLLASYPANSDNLSSSGVQVLSIYATQDGLATGDKIDVSRPLLPADTIYIAIQGGNHGQFGYYGLQSGDRPATISRADQQGQMVKATIDFLNHLSK